MDDDDDDDDDYDYDDTGDDIPSNIKQFELPSVDWYGGEDGSSHFFKHV